jgi:purine-binding chemotaxis protein CheW
MNQPPQDSAEILRVRARALAQTPKRQAEVETILEVLEFRLAHEAYAVETPFVREVYPLKDLTPLPCTPPFVRGVVNVRGRILPVLDLKKFFGLPEKGLTDLHRIILVSNSDLEIGLLADSVVGVRAIPAECIQPSLPTLTGIRADYLKGVTSERLVVLDIAHLLADPRIVVHEEVEP